MACPDSDHWDIVYAYACRTFGQTPMADAERQVFNAFVKYPALVRNEIDSIKTALDNGKVKWAWSALATRVDRQTPFAAQADAAKEKERAVKQAERYIVHAGAHYDRWETELHDELFGDRGTLRDWNTDSNLTSRLEQLWQQQRPRALAVEERQDADAAKHRDHRATLEAHREQLRQEGERTSSEAIQHIIDTAAATTPTDDEEF